MESKLLEQTQYCSLADVAGKFFFLEICQIEITCLIQLVLETYVVALSKPHRNKTWRGATWIY